MEFKKEIFKKIASIAFVLALLMPTTVQLVHALEGHHHTVCNNFKSHIHQKKLNCSVCDFHFSSFNFTTEYVSVLTEVEENFGLNSIYFFSETTPSPYHYLLRGPPLFS